MDRYIGMDVHSQTCTVVVMGPSGKRLNEWVVDTNGKTLVDTIRNVSGSRHLCMEEGAQSQWLYETLERHVDELVVVQPSKHHGNKSDSIDAWGLAEQIRTGAVRMSRVFKSKGRPRLRVAVRAQRAAMRDMVRSKNRLKDVFRSRAIEVDAKIYSAKHRELWFKKLPVADRLLAEHLSHHLDAMLETYKRANAWLEDEAAKVPEVARLCSVPGIGTIGAARIVATVVTPDRFRTKRQFWSYCGFGIVTRSTSDWRRRGGNFERRDIQLTRGLNRNCQPMLKSVFKAAAICVLKIKSNPLRIAYDKTVASGTKPNLATLTVARRIAAASLAIWKRKEVYDSSKHCAKLA